MNKTKERILYLDILRILATFAVITIHVTGMHWMQKNVYSGDWQIYNIYRALVRWAVPVFIMISGSLFLETGKQLNIKNYIRKI